MPVVAAAHTLSEQTVAMRRYKSSSSPGAQYSYDYDRHTDKVQTAGCETVVQDAKADWRWMCLVQFKLVKEAPLL